MKVLGANQFSKKKFKTLGISGEFAGLLGDLPKGFIGIIYGESGNGKTEVCVRIAKYFSTLDKVAWFSYEQGHGLDLQKAFERNGITASNRNILIVDPKITDANEKRPVNERYFDDLWSFLNRRRSPRFVFIDSLDYTRFTTDQYFKLKEKFGDTHCLIFISHCENNKPESKTGKKVEYDGAFGVLVKHFIAMPKKSRYGGTEDYIIWEEKARQRNPIYFAKKEAGTTEKRGKGRPRKNK